MSPLTAMTACAIILAILLGLTMRRLAAVGDRNRKVEAILLGIINERKDWENGQG